jgi:hypothetical protein
VNTTTKPLFEETLDIVFECFDKYKSGRPLLPVECLKDYQLIYNENKDDESIINDDNQLFTERVPTRHSIKDLSSRSSFNRSLPRINTSRTSTTTTSTTTTITDGSTNSDMMLPTVNESDVNKTIVTRIVFEPIKPTDLQIAHERLMYMKSLRLKYTFPTFTRTLIKMNKTNIKRPLSSNHAYNIQRKKRIDLKPISLDHKKRTQQQNNTKSTCIDVDKKENILVIEKIEQDQESQSIIISNIIEEDLNEDSSTVYTVH